MGGRRWDDYVSIPPPPSYPITYYVPIPSESSSMGCFSRIALILGWMFLIFILLGLCSCTSLMFC